MERVKRAIQEMYLILLDVDSVVKKIMAIELVIAIMFLILGLIWGTVWFALALIVFLYVVYDIWSAFSSGIMESITISGTSLGIKRRIDGIIVHIKCHDGRTEKVKVPYRMIRHRIRPGDYVEVKIYPHGEDGIGQGYYVLEYYVVPSKTKED